MLLGRTLGKRLEPVGYVCHSMFERPGFHSGSNSVSCLSVKVFSIVYAGEEGLEGCCIEVLAHLLAVKHKFSKVL